MSAETAVGRRGSRRLWALAITLVVVLAVYLSLPRSWFVIPDEKAQKPAAPSASPQAVPAPTTFDEAALRDAATKAPLDFAAHTRYAMALSQTGQSEAAEREFNTARRLAPESPVIYHNLGVFYLNSGQIERAQDIFSRELEVAPGDGRAHYYRGLCFQKLRKSREAIAQFKTAIALTPDLPDPYLALALEGTKTEPEDLIRQNVDRYIALTGNKGLAYYVLSGAYRTWHRYDSAVRYGEMSVAAEPDNFAYWHNLGQDYTYAKRYADAEKALTKALALSKDPTTVLIELGMNAQFAKRFDDAIGYFRKGLAASPKTGEIHQYLARVLRLKGDESAALAEDAAFRAWERSSVNPLRGGNDSHKSMPGG